MSVKLNKHVLTALQFLAEKLHCKIITSRNTPLFLINSGIFTIGHAARFTIQQSIQQSSNFTDKIFWQAKSFWNLCQFWQFQHFLPLFLPKCLKACLRAGLQGFCKALKKVCYKFHAYILLIIYIFLILFQAFWLEKRLEKKSIVYIYNIKPFGLPNLLQKQGNLKQGNLKQEVRYARKMFHSHANPLPEPKTSFEKGKKDQNNQKQPNLKNKKQPNLKNRRQEKC